MTNYPEIQFTRQTCTKCGSDVLVSQGRQKDDGTFFINVCDPEPMQFISTKGFYNKGYVIHPRNCVNIPPKVKEPIEVREIPKPKDDEDIPF